MLFPHEILRSQTAILDTLLTESILTGRNMRPHPGAADFAMILRICLDAGIEGTNKLLCGDQEQSGEHSNPDDS